MSAVVVLFDPIRVAPRGQEAADASSIAPFGGGKQAGARGRGGCHGGRGAVNSGNPKTAEKSGVTQQGGMPRPAFDVCVVWCSLAVRLAPTNGCRLNRQSVQVLSSTFCGNPGVTV